jgi:hypothetical protein
MSPFFTPEEGAYAPKIPPLRSRTLDGRLYQRPEHVDAQIAEIMGLRHHQRVSRLPDLLHEAVVHCIRRMRLSSKPVYGLFVQELCRRIFRIARRHTRELDKVTREDILTMVEIGIMKLVLADKPSRKTEILEIAFARVVEKRTLNMVRNYERSPWSRKADIVPPHIDEDDDEEVERPIELAVDDREGPEIQVVQSMEAARKAQQVQTGYAAVKDPLDLKAVKLHFEDGLPISSKDPGKPDVVGVLGESRGQVNYRLSRAYTQIRKALGVKK